MPHEPEPRRPDEEQSADYGYDMAHEVTAGDAVGTRGTERRRAVYVPTETADRGQDYGYDLAHDVPRIKGD
jgi:hypothetical protein